MHSTNLRIWGLIQAEMVRVEAFKAANVERERNGYALAYDEAAFEEAADRITALVEQFVLTDS